MNNTEPKPCKKCRLCCQPVATQSESPVAFKAGLCKPCFELYFSLGLLGQVLNLKAQS